MVNYEPMTQQAYERIRSRIEQMENVEMPAISDKIATAREEGDLKENAEYHAQREAQGMLQAKIDQLKAKLSRASIIDPTKIPKDQVAFGATIRVKDLEFDDEEEFTLVGAGDEDPESGKYPINSPIGHGLLGAKVGQKVEIPVPKGTLKFEILEIRYENLE